MSAPFVVHGRQYPLMSWRSEGHDKADVRHQVLAVIRSYRFDGPDGALSTVVRGPKSQTSLASVVASVMTR